MCTLSELRILKTIRIWHSNKNVPAKCRLKFYARLESAFKSVVFSLSLNQNMDFVLKYVESKPCLHWRLFNLFDEFRYFWTLSVNSFEKEELSKNLTVHKTGDSVLSCSLLEINEAFFHLIRIFANWLDRHLYSSIDQHRSELCNLRFGQRYYELGSTQCRSRALLPILSVFCARRVFYRKVLILNNVWNVEQTHTDVGLVWNTNLIK